jgi:hypothetical protein
MNGEAVCSKVTPLGWSALPTCTADLGIAGYGPHPYQRDGRWSTLWWATVPYDFLRWSHPGRVCCGATCDGEQLEW